MDMELKASFVKAWQEYFNQAELPLVFFYSSQPGNRRIGKARCGPPMFYWGPLQGAPGGFPEF